MGAKGSKNNQPFADAAAGVSAAANAFSAACETAGKETMAAASEFFANASKGCKAAVDAATTTVPATCESAGKAASEFFNNAKKAAADAMSALPAACDRAGKAAMDAAAEFLERTRKAAADTAVAASKTIKKALDAIFSANVKKALARGFLFLEKLLGIEIPFGARVAIAVGAVAVAAGLYIAAFMAAGAMISAPGGGGLMMLRWTFAANPALYFWLLRTVGPAAAVAGATLCSVLPPVSCILLVLSSVYFASITFAFQG